MQNSKNKLQLFQSAGIQVAGILLLIFLAVLMMWFNNVNSTQAMSATVAMVRFYGEYRIGEGQWQEITEGQHIPATKGDVTLRGNFHMLSPDGTYVGVYRGELGIFETHSLNGPQRVVNEMRLDLRKHNRNTTFLQFCFYYIFFSFQSASLQFQLLCFCCGIDVSGDQTQYHKALNVYVP